MTPMTRAAAVAVSLLTTAAVLAGPAAGAPAPAAPAAPTAPVAELPREIRGGVELTLADGDLLRVWAAKDYRTVWARRHDAVAGSWGQRREVLRRKHLFCGGVDARTANGAVAVLARCDHYGFAEDQAPTASRAIWSADTLTWSSHALDGEAYEEPGISPDGLKAVWPQHGGYLTRTPAGFAPHRLDADGQEYTVTATISDAEQVSFLYGAAVSRRRCALVVLTRTGDAAPVRQDVPLAGACSDVALANVDADTAWFGDSWSPAQRAVVSRPDASSPWALTQVAPATAPGLELAERGLTTDYVTAPGLPLYAVGSPGRRVIEAQAYDPVAQAWGAPVVIRDAGGDRCRWDDSGADEPFAVLMVHLRCGGAHVVLTTRDGATWHALRLGRAPYGVSPDGRYVALPGRAQVYVLSREQGVVTLPVELEERCDVVVPDGPDAAVLLTAAGRHRGWPTVLKASTASGWRPLSRTRLPTFDSPCRHARSSFYDRPYRFDLFGGTHGYAVRIVERDGAWRALRARF